LIDALARLPTKYPTAYVVMPHLRHTRVFVRRSASAANKVYTPDQRARDREHEPLKAFIFKIPRGRCADLPWVGHQGPYSIVKEPARGYSKGTRNSSSSSSPGNTGRSVLALNAAIRHDGRQWIWCGRVGSNISPQW